MPALAIVIGTLLAQAPFLVVALGMLTSAVFRDRPQGPVARAGGVQ